MSEAHIYRCSCSCGCRNETEEDGELCYECLETCIAPSDQENIKYDFCVFCGQDLDGDVSHCGKKCLEKCKRHDCLWFCGKCSQCCCLCECKEIV